MTHELVGRSFDAGYPRNPVKPEGGGMGAWSLVVAFVVLVSMVVICAALLTPARHHAGERHEYGGVTWIGDDCRVVGDGTLICLVTQSA